MMMMVMEEMDKMMIMSKMGMGLENVKDDHDHIFSGAGMMIMPKFGKVLMISR